MASATGTATLNFAAGSNEATVVVSGQTTISATSKASAYVMADDTTGDHSARDHRYFATLCGLSCSTPVAATSFSIFARSPHKLNGTFLVRWVWAD